MRHLEVDVQVAWFSEFDTGIAFAPAVQGYLYERGSSPYVGVGFQYVYLTWKDVTASGFGYFANVGYEWKWKSGLGILVGGGVQHLQNISATDGATSISTGGDTGPNLEFGLRYRFP